MEIRKNIARGAAILGLSAALTLPVIALADESTNTNGSTNTNMSTNASMGRGDKMKDKMMKNAVDATCMKAAVTKRDDAVIAAWDALTAAAKSALTTRKTALLAAWDLTDAKARRAALADAWKAYATSVRDARKAFRTARLAAWAQFRTDRAACHGTGEDHSNAGQDASL